MANALDDKKVTSESKIRNKRRPDVLCGKRTGKLSKPDDEGKACNGGGGFGWKKKRGERSFIRPIKSIIQRINPSARESILRPTLLGWMM
ncbi:MAG: hypothetical protein N3G78_14785 [Desulfobacterota bacterium]|nr:hypothetical protein [Thermodesulfobacteriota bacterium]